MRGLLVLLLLTGCGGGEMQSATTTSMPRPVPSVEAARLDSSAGVTVETSANVPSPRQSPKRASRSRHVHRAATGRSLGRLSVTAYCQGSITASGKRPRPGMAATLDRRIRFGTRMRVGGRVVVVEDRIGHSSDIDVWFDDCADAIQFGRRRLEVVVLP